MYRTSKRAVYFLIIVLLNLATPALAAASQALVSIDGNKITQGDLETALASSPFYTQFNTLDEDEQAAMRGDMLKRLVTARLLAAEAHKLGLEKTPAFQRDLDEYVDGVRYQKYLNNLRESISLSPEQEQELREKYAGEVDAYSAARSSLIAKRYQALFQLTLQKLRDQYHVKIFQERITPGIKADTVLMSGDKLQITYGDLIGKSNPDFDRDNILEKLYQRAEYLMISRAASAENMDLSTDAGRYAEQRLPALLVENKVKEWIPDDATLQKYFMAHPELHRLKDRWHIGQLVVSTEQEAKDLRQKIVDGESSLFQLAEKYSIDPGAHFNKGDLGWVLEGTGMPEIEAAIRKMDNDEISPVIKTARGYHLVTVLKRRSGAVQDFNNIKDKIRQMFINEKMSHYLAELQQQHQVKWLIMERDQKKAQALLESKHKASTR